MRASIFLLLTFAFLGLFLWQTLSGALFFIGCLFWLSFLVITAGYQDTMLLFLLGAREVRSSDEKIFFEAASQESYKLTVPMPRLYFYNGSLERAYVFQTRSNVSLVLNKVLLEKSSSDELNAICFELLLQVKKNMAAKRTRSMFFLGLLTWIIHFLLNLLTKIFPFKDVWQATDWFFSFLFQPFLEILFKLIMGENYFKKLENFLSDFPEEKRLLMRVGMKLRKPYSHYSLSSRKLLELQSVGRSRHFQNIMALEFLPHEWDYFFKSGEFLGAE